MASYQFRLPDIGEGVAEAEIVAWHVKLGDPVKEDQPLLDVMTDKATVDMSSPVEGVVTAVHGELGSKAPVGSVLVELELVGAGTELQAGPALAAPSPLSAAIPAVREPESVNASPTASPSTRRRAMEWGIALEDVRGTGPHGRILTEDLENYQRAKEKQSSVEPQDGVHETKLIGLRRKIADKMQESKRHIPHFAYIEEFDLTELERLRVHLNSDRGDGQPKLTLLPFFMRALVKVISAFPNTNAHYDEEAGVLRRFDAVHVGIATQTPAGLMVPVVRHVEARDLWDCARELQRVTASARNATASRDELSGSTITLSSLGALGGIAATPIINSPEVAILGPNKLTERAVVDGAFLARRRVMNLSSSFDHRVVDGHDAASFIQRLKTLLEHPALIFLD